MKKNKYIALLILALGMLYACDDKDIDTSNDLKFSITDGVSLKTVATQAGIPIGIGIDYTPYMNDAAYANIVNSEFDNVTYGYQMKHGAMVDATGNLNFTKSDAMYDKLTAAGLVVYGHTLAWHQNNNREYLASLVQLTAVAKGENLIPNGTFESSGISGWSKFNGSSPNTLSHVTGGLNSHTGTGGMQIINAENNAGGQWKTQINASFAGGQELESGATYILTFWIRSTSANGSGRCSTSGTAQYQNSFATSTDWQEITWTIVAQGGEKGLSFDMGAVANTYIIDDIELSKKLEGSSPITPETIQKNKQAIDNAMKTWITQMVGHYKGKVKAWDVVNEPMLDGDSGLRYGEAPKSEGDLFYWQYFLGRDYALNAFKYAQQADANALLFINDYNLETNNAKLDSLINYVKELKAKGAKIDGIGTQIHINWNAYAGIDNMFQKLAATGLLIKVTELDVKLNLNKNTNYMPSEEYLNYQAVMYKKIIESYIRHVPASQRYGITVWGVTDADSWITNDAPCLWNKDYTKKPAYSGLMQGLQFK